MTVGKGARAKEFEFPVRDLQVSRNNLGDP
jgi:hypothetical protein